MWTANSELIRRIGEETLGRTTGKCAPDDKETWWWNDEVQAAVKKKKTLKRVWDTTGDQRDKEVYKAAKANARRKVAQAKSRAWDEIYGELETLQGQKKLFQLAKQRNKASKDLTQIKQMKDEQGHVLVQTDDIKKRWKEYFERLLNEENPRTVVGDGLPNKGPRRMCLERKS